MNCKHLSRAIFPEFWPGHSYHEEESFASHSHNVNALHYLRRGSGDAVDHVARVLIFELEPASQELGIPEPASMDKVRDRCHWRTNSRRRCFLNI